MQPRIGSDSIVPSLPPPPLPALASPLSRTASLTSHASLHSNKHSTVLGLVFPLSSNFPSPPTSLLLPLRKSISSTKL